MISEVEAGLENGDSGLWETGRDIYRLLCAQPNATQ